MTIRELLSAFLEWLRSFVEVYSWQHNWLDVNVFIVIGVVIAYFYTLWLLVLFVAEIYFNVFDSQKRKENLHALKPWLKFYGVIFVFFALVIVFDEVFF